MSLSPIKPTFTILGGEVIFFPQINEKCNAASYAVGSRDDRPATCSGRKVDSTPASHLPTLIHFGTVSGAPQLDSPERAPEQARPHVESHTIVSEGLLCCVLWAKKVELERGNARAGDSH